MRLDKLQEVLLTTMFPIFNSQHTANPPGRNPPYLVHMDRISNITLIELNPVTPCAS